MNRCLRLLAVICLLLLPLTAGAGELRPGDIDPGDVVREVPGMPARGTTMAEVESRLGSPQARHPAIGEPPISRWVYPEFTVYFEHDRVIHSVRRRD